MCVTPRLELISLLIKFLKLIKGLPKTIGEHNFLTLNTILS